MNKQLDIIFVHPNGSKELFQKLSENHSAIEFPIWCGMLANACKVKGFGVQLLDCEAERLNYLESASVIKDVKARIVCFVCAGQNPNASTQNMEGATATAIALKEIAPETKILFTGAHVAALPKQTLKESFIDLIAQNEGVYTILDLLKVNIDEESELKMVKGLGYKDKDGNVILNIPSKLVPNELLEVDLPGIAFDLLPDIKKYRTSHWHSWTNNTKTSPFASFYSSIGCKFFCNFCMINIINRTNSADNITAADSNVFRHWSPEFVIKQFDKFAKLGIKNVKIADELWVYMPRHFLKICDLLIERNYGFNCWAYSRIDTCKPEYLDKLKKAGVNWLAVGVENPDAVVRKDIHKGGFKEVRIADLFEMIKNAGICIGANYIHGLPNETMETIQYTRDFMMNNLTENMNIYMAQALPGSPLYMDSIKKGIQLPTRYSAYSQHSYYTEGLPTEKLTSAEILKFRDETWDLYFTNPKYLEMMNNKFGQKCVDSIKDMTKIKLKRKLFGDPEPD